MNTQAVILIVLQTKIQLTILIALIFPQTMMKTQAIAQTRNLNGMMTVVEAAWYTINTEMNLK